MNRWLPFLAIRGGRSLLPVDNFEDVQLVVVCGFRFPQPRKCCLWDCPDPIHRTRKSRVAFAQIAFAQIAALRVFIDSSWLHC